MSVRMFQNQFQKNELEIGSVKKNRKTREKLIMHELHHTRADTDRLYVSRKEGGGD
jgi:hypothetical protein